MPGVQMGMEFPQGNGRVEDVRTLVYAVDNIGVVAIGDLLNHGELDLDAPSTDHVSTSDDNPNVTSEMIMPLSTATLEPGQHVSIGELFANFDGRNGFSIRQRRY